MRGRFSGYIRLYMASSVPSLEIADACRASLSVSPLRDSLACPAVGYARFAVEGPALQRQRDTLAEMGCASVLADALSGASTNRPGLDQAISLVRPGSVVLVETLSVLTWREDDLREVWSRIRAKGGALVALTERLDTRSSLEFDDYCSVMARFAASVRLSRRVEARVRRPDGRVRIPEAAWLQIRSELVAETLSVAAAARQLGVRRSTIYRRLEAVPSGAV